LSFEGPPEKSAEAFSRFAFFEEGIKVFSGDVFKDASEAWI
jgi:hypothetical protein